MKRVQLSWATLVILAVGLLLVGAGMAYLWLPGTGTPPPLTSSGGTSAPAAQMKNGPLPDVVIDLSEDAVAKAGIVVSPATVVATSGTIRLSGVVEPNAYRQVAVTPLVSGRVVSVTTTLGEHVSRNTPLVEIYSPDLAEAQTRYLSTRADLEAVEKEVARTDRLTTIGAASQQELEQVHAEHVRRRTEVESARTRLQLLGMTAQQIDTVTSTGEVTAATTVVSPIAGVVTARAVNPGATVDAATPLVTVVDLSTVWVVGDLYERDFSQVSVGSRAAVTTTAFPDQRISGRVAYIDPQVRSETRTAKIRIEVPNPGQRLRLGMYAEVLVETPGPDAQSILVPPASIQNVADRTVLFLADPGRPGRFIEREVQLGEASADRVVIQHGLKPGDRVVTSGSFSLRAERERLGLRPSR